MRNRRNLGGCDAKSIFPFAFTSESLTGEEDILQGVSLVPDPGVY